MTITADLIGTRLGPRVTVVSRRWCRAFTEVLEPHGGDAGRTQEANTAHPIFSVAVEWPLLQQWRNSLNESERLRGVHYTHDVLIDRLVRPGDVLTTCGEVVAVSALRAGVYVLIRLRTQDATGAFVATTFHGSVYRGLAVEPAEPAARELGAEQLSPGAPVQTAALTVPPAFGLAYAKSSRIRNPIHTDPVAARAAGLPGVILHGSAVLGLAVSKIISLVTNTDPSRVSRVVATFGAMVSIPSTLTLNVFAVGPALVTFEVLTPQGGRAIRNGAVTLRTRRARTDEGDSATAAVLDNLVHRGTKFSTVALAVARRNQ